MRFGGRAVKNENVVPAPPVEYIENVVAGQMDAEEAVNTGCMLNGFTVTKAFPLQPPLSTSNVKVCANNVPGGGV